MSRQEITAMLSRRRAFRMAFLLFFNALLFKETEVTMTREIGVLKRRGSDETYL